MAKVEINLVKKENERDFTSDPIDITTETYGTLPGDRDTKQTALETAVNIEEIEAKDVQAALVELVGKIEQVKEGAENNTGTTQTAEQVPFESDKYDAKDVDAALNEVMQKAKDAQIESLPAEKVTFESPNFASQNVKEALDELFTQSDSNRKNLITAIGAPLEETSTFVDSIATIIDSKALLAEKLNAKGVIAESGMSYSELANLILAIKATDSKGVIKFTDPIEATENAEHTIAITPYVKPSDSILQVYKYEPEGASIIYYKNEFDNTNSKSFNYDPDLVQFGTIMTVKDTYIYPLTAISDYYESQEIDFSKFIEFGGDAVYDNSNITLKGIKTNEIVVTAQGDIPLDDVITVNSVYAAVVGDIKIAVSVDSGVTWQTYKNGNFEPLDILNIANFGVNGMSAETVNAITGDEWMTLKGDSIFIRFAYYINKADYSTTSGTDLITINANMLARWVPAETSDITASFDAVAQEYKLKFLKNGTYKVAYKDSE